MEGISYLTDETGQRKAIVIDINTYKEELEDFLDGLEAESRRNEPKEDSSLVVERIWAETKEFNPLYSPSVNQEEEAKLMNDQLLSLYNDYLPEINSHIAECVKKCNWEMEKISKIFLMHVSDEYVKSKPRIMFVGSETHGWDQYQYNDTAESLTNFHKLVTENVAHFNSPFWWFRNDFSDAIGIEDNFKKATLWTNLSKIDVNKEKPEGKEFGELSQLFIKLLVAEINIVKPDILLIMTTDGHYKWHINNYNWLTNKPFSNIAEPSGLERKPLLNSKIDRLVVKELLPQNTFQFPHPNSFRFIKGGYKKHANEVIEKIKDNLL